MRRPQAVGQVTVQTPTLFLFIANKARSGEADGKVWVMHKVTLLSILIGLLFNLPALKAQTSFVYNDLTYTIISSDEVELTGVPYNFKEIMVPESVLYDDESGSRSRSVLEYTVTSIGSYVFSNNRTVMSVVLPKTINVIKEGAFYQATSLKDINLPEEISVIEEQTFMGCESLERIVLPNKLSVIGNRAFKDCKSLTSLNLPSSLLSIGQETYTNCESLSEIDFPQSLETISYGAFSNCSNIMSINLPSDLSILNYNVFYGCINLREIILPENLEVIEGGVFENCRSLPSIAIPKKVKEINTSAFNGCTLLENIYVHPDNQYYSSSEGILCNKSGNSLIYYPSGKGDNVLLPSTIQEISDRAFTNQDIASVNLPEGLEYIGEYAFGECEKLVNIKFPVSLIEIGRAAFDWCTGLGSVSFPLNSKLRIIRERGFENCSNLSYVDLPASIEVIEGKVFEDDKRLRTLICRAKTPPSLSEKVFSTDGNENWTKTQLCVPFGCVDIYRSTYPWSKFINIIEIEEKVKITLNINSATLLIGNTLNLEAKVTGCSTSGTVIWTSENPEIATVDEKGLVTALAEGVTKIIATYGKVSASCALSVETEGGESRKMRIRQSVINLYKGESLQLSVYLPSDNPEYQKVEWESGDPNIASVSNNGVVYGINYGATFIKASCEGLFANCLVNVIENIEEGNNNGSDTGIKELKDNPDAKISIYRLNGLLIKKDCKIEELRSLPKGIYIITSGNKGYKITI